MTETKEKQEVIGGNRQWLVIVFAAFILFGTALSDPIGIIIGGAIAGIYAYCSSSKNGGNTSALRWTAIGIATGGALGAFLVGTIGTIFGGAITGILAYRSSSKNGGDAPAWLWKSKKNKKFKSSNEQIISNS